MEPTYPLGSLTLDEMIEVSKSLSISIDVTSRRLARTNPDDHNHLDLVVRRLHTARAVVDDALVNALTQQEAA